MTLAQSKIERWLLNSGTLAVLLFLLQPSGLLFAQAKKTTLPDGVVKYEVQAENQEQPSFWLEFRDLFRASPVKRPFEKSYAILIGVSRYRSLDPQLPYGRSDLEEMKQFLISQAGRVPHARRSIAWA